jgi:hypothetical protein
LLEIPETFREPHDTKEVDMPGLEGLKLAEFLPLAPLHWVSILHYLVLIGTIAMLMSTGDQTPTLFLFVLAIEGLLTGVSLYANFFSFVLLFIWLARVAIFAIPIVIAGMGPTEATRSMSIFVALMAIPILVSTFITCSIQIAADPRLLVMNWCP